MSPSDKRCTGCRRNENTNKQEKRGPCHGLNANRSATRCQCADAFTDMALRFRVAHPSGMRKFPLRQGLWIEDLQIPPGQECSNGSMILLAVVLWRASFFGKQRHSACSDPLIHR